MRPASAACLAGYLLLLWSSIVAADTQTITAAPGTNISSQQCSAQGLKGECNSCVCCCFSGSSAFINYGPTSDCTCDRKFDSGELKLAAVLAVIVIVPTLLASCYLGGQLWISPYKKNEERQGNESPSRPSSPAPQEPRTTARRARSGGTVELSVRTA